MQFSLVRFKTTLAWVLAMATLLGRIQTLEAAQESTQTKNPAKPAAQLQERPKGKQAEKYPPIRRIERKWFETEDRYAVGQRLISLRPMCMYLSGTNKKSAEHCQAALDDDDTYQPIADFTTVTTWMATLAFIPGIFIWTTGHPEVAIYSGAYLGGMLAVQISISPWRDSREQHIQKALDAYHGLTPQPPAAGGQAQLRATFQHRF